MTEGTDAVLDVLHTRSALDFASDGSTEHSVRISAGQGTHDDTMTARPQERRTATKQGNEERRRIDDDDGGPHCTHRSGNQENATRRTGTRK